MAIEYKKNTLMEEVRRVAQAYYIAGPNDVRIKADEFYNAMDDDGDGYISQDEFMSFMQQTVGATKLSSMAMFWQLNSMGEEKLNMMDVMTLYYVMKSGRPFCDGRRCGGGLVCGVYFACTQCFDTSNCSFLCSECFEHKEHNHDRTHLFLDNFTLLLHLRKPTPSASYNNQLASSSVNIVEYDDDAASSSLAIVPVQKEKMRKRKKAFKAFDKAVTYAFMATQTCLMM